MEGTGRPWPRFSRSREWEDLRVRARERRRSSARARRRHRKGNLEISTAGRLPDARGRGGSWQRPKIDTGGQSRNRLHIWNFRRAVGPRRGNGKVEMAARILENLSEDLPPFRHG